MNRASYLALAFLACSAVHCVAQETAPQEIGNQVAGNMGELRQRNREDEIARIIVGMRANAGLIRLKRLRSSGWEIQLTCTAAVENRPLENWVGVQVFRVHAPQELTANAAFSHLITKEADKELPRYSVTVFLNPSSRSEPPELVVGIFPQESWSDHLKGCLFTEDGCDYSSSLKKMVAPACRDVR
jgi:hypothetical protein